MAEEDMFAGLKKKSKKVKINLDEVLGGDEAPAAIASTETKENKEDEAAPATAAAGGDEPELDFSDMKKKKKAKKEIPMDLGNDAPAEAAEESIPQVTDQAVGDFGDLKKKKKSKKSAKAFDLEAFEREIGQADANPIIPVAATDGDDDDGPEPEEREIGAEGTEEIGDIFAAGGGGGGASAGTDGGALGKEAWIGTSRDYTYPELLGRFYSLLHAQNPELAGDRKKLTLVPPAVSREGTKKTLFANLGDICKRMHRNPKHVMEFLFAELGTSGSVDGSQRLVIKGRYTQKSMENVLRRYIVEYVVCKTCKSPDTLLNKDNRLYFVTCESCGSRRSVAPIKTGFQAQIGRRVKPVS